MERIKHFKVTNTTYTALTHLWANQTGTQARGPSYRFFCHLLGSTLSRFRKYCKESNGWVPMHSQFIQAKFRGANLTLLTEASLIEVDRVYIPNRRPRQYRVKGWVIDEYMACIENPVNDCWVNLLTGKRWRLEWERTAKRSVNDALFIPPIVGKVLESIRPTPINRVALEAHLLSMKRAYKQDKTSASRFRYRNDLLIVDEIRKLAHGPPDKDGVCWVQPRYRMHSTGRIGTVLQGASREMKSAIYANIPNLYNYDLVSSQVAIAFHLIQAQGLNTDWLEDYLKIPSQRKAYAHYVGISEKAWKECLCSLLMGAHLPNNVTYKPNLKAAIVQTLSEGASEGALNVTLERFRDTVKALLPSLRAWHASLVKAAEESGSITNALGIKRELTEFNGNKAAMVAHLLQGIESYYIHMVTCLAPCYGFEVVGNEHDGLITLGEIPEVAIHEANTRTGIRYLVLRQKPFAQYRCDAKK